LRITKPLTLGLLSRPYEFRREFRLAVAVVAFVPVGDIPTLLAETAMWPFLGEEMPPDQALDAVMPKQQAEFLAVTHAFAPGGKAVGSLKVGIQLGPIVKQLNVFGDRRLVGGRATEPAPFGTMKLDWTRAFGGEGFADNPQGRGFVPFETAEGAAIDLPNVVDPRQAERGFRHVAGFGPVDQMWPSRAQLVGTHDAAWLANEFPGFAGDIDWRFFNAAPQDQWLPGMLKGDETYAFNNLHPERPLIKGRLPSMAPRLFLMRRSSDDFEEVKLSLSTVWFFPHRDRAILIHHGSVAVAEEDSSDVTRVVIGADPQGALRPASHYRAVMEKRIARDGGVHALVDADLVPAAWLQPDPSADAVSVMQDDIASMRRQQRRGAEIKMDAQRAGMPEGVRQNLPPMAPEPKLPTLEELPAFVASMRAEAEASHQNGMAMLAAKEAESAANYAQAGLSVEDIRASRSGKPKGPPAFSAAALHAQQMGTARYLRGIGMPNASMEASLADPATAAQWAKAEADLREVYRLSAHTQAPASPATPQRNAEIRAALASGDAASRALFDLHGADLAGLDLSGMDLSGICLDGAKLSGTNFTGTNLSRAVLAHARMDRCLCDGADLTEANLGNADLSGASLRRAKMGKAVLAEADLSGANLEGAFLEGANLSKAIFSGARLANVKASGVVAMDLSLAGIVAPGIVLDQAKFLNCDLANVDFSGASLHRTVFLNCNMENARLTRTRLSKSVFVEKCQLAGADFSDSDLSEANLRGTIMPSCRLDRTKLTNADLSEADLTGASLVGACAIGARFVTANLGRAVLADGNFAQADLSRADLRGTDMRKAGFYEANLSRVKRDTSTRASDIFAKRMRFHPRLPAERVP
jgi:uncharacterized protein YjbI with pentapeptide repeats